MLSDVNGLDSKKADLAKVLVQQNVQPKPQITFIYNSFYSSFIRYLHTEDMVEVRLWWWLKKPKQRLIAGLWQDMTSSLLHESQMCFMHPYCPPLFRQDALLPAKLSNRNVVPGDTEGWPGQHVLIPNKLPFNLFSTEVKSKAVQHLHDHAASLNLDEQQKTDRCASGLWGRRIKWFCNNFLKV